MIFRINRADSMNRQGCRIPSSSTRTEFWLSALLFLNIKSQRKRMNLLNFLNVGLLGHKGNLVRQAENACLVLCT